MNIRYLISIITFIFSALWCHSHLLVVYALWHQYGRSNEKYEFFLRSHWHNKVKHLPSGTWANIIPSRWNAYDGIDVSNIRHCDAIRIILPSYKEISQIIPDAVPVNPHQHVTTVYYQLFHSLWYYICIM